MDVKNLRTETALSERNNDGSKYTQGGVALQCNRNKSYQDIGSNPLAKAEPIPVRPCAVIGPDRVVPPTASNDPYIKKGPVESWLSPDNGYRRPPEYPHKICNQNPSRNISPRQTFQENMQRIMVPPTYNAARHSDDANFNHIQDRNVIMAKNVKTNLATETKYCDVPYSINTLANEPKNVRDTEMYIPSANLPLTRTAPHVWPPGSVNVHAARTYGAHELYQYPQYSSCAGQRPSVIPINRPHRTIQEDATFVYPEHYYPDAGARFKPYPPPPVKERYPQPRYEYIGNYPSQFHPPPPIQPLKYDMSKSGSHPYSVYPQLKYLENRVPDHTLEGYQRPPTNQQPHYNLQFHNQVIHPNYAPVPGNSSQNKVHPYPPDGSGKTVASNKLHYDNSSKMYIDYENTRTKTYPMADNYFVNEMGRVHPVKSQMVMPNYSSVGMHSIPSQQYYRKDTTQMKPFEYMPHFRNFEPHLNNSTMLRHAPQFSPNTLAISPTDSSINNDASQTHGTSQEDCGYVSQSSTASVRSIDSGIYRHPHEYYKRYDFRYGPIGGNSHTLTKSDLNSNNVNSKENKQHIDVRQFLQMWNEGEEENNYDNNNSKEIVIQTSASDTSNLPKQHLSNQDQLYVLGLVNVSSEDLSKYEHIQKISKLPENIKGYNNLELLSQFEEVIESSNTSSFKSIPKEYQITSKENSTKHVVEAMPRPLSPLDVEAKISQSVIHKEVGCNFEIRPCSPKMLNVEVAAPAHNVLGERAIEKVTNPLSKIVKSPMPIKPDENSNCHTIKRQESNFTINDNPSCKMIKSPYATNNMNSVKTNYSLQDLEINSGVCLASLPRLDNEIELHFPEVNQQFINANKKDNNSTTKNGSQCNIGEDSNLSDGKLVRIGLENDVVVEESDKTFTKLSKYRKLKANTADYSINNQLTKAVRTDSVIIKNPENIKNIENKLLENSFNAPINLSSQSSVCHDVPNTSGNDVDIALDFSLNKSSNNLPVIEMEKEESTTSFATHLSLSCENVSPSDTSESFNESTNFDNEILNEKATNIKCNKANNQGLNIKMNDGTTIEDTIIAIKSDVEINVTDTLISDNTCSENLILEETDLTQKNLSNHYDTRQVINNHSNEMSDSLETCSHQEFDNSKKQDTYTVTTSIDNICKKSNLSDSENRSNLVLPHIGNVSEYREIRDPIQFICLENEKVVNRKSNKLVITPQKDDDFEHDEISASLEKLFQESVEDSVVANSDDICLDKSMPLKSLYSLQSKELYSPWIQKLLMYSEGLCSNTRRESTQKESVNKYITNEDRYLDKLVSINTDIFKDKHSQNMDIDHNTGPTDLLNITTSNKILIKKATENLTSDAKCIIEACSYAKNRKPHTVIDTIKATYTNFSQQKSDIQDSQIIQQKTDVSNVNKTCVDKSSSKLKTGEKRKINPKFDVESEKGDTNVHELNTLQDLQSINNLLNYESNISTDTSANSKMKTAYCETYTGSATCETFSSINSACNPENIIKVDSGTSSFEDQFVSSNNQNRIEKKFERKCLVENVISNHDSDPDNTLEISDTNNTVHENRKIIDRNLNNGNFESLSNNISDSVAHQIEENQSATNLVEDVFNDYDKCGTSKTFDSTVIEQEYQNHCDLKNVSNDISDCDGLQTEQNQDEKKINENINIESVEHYTCKTLQEFKSSNTYQEDDNYSAGHQLKENQDKENKLKNSSIEDHDNASDKFYSNNIVQEDHNIDLQSSSESIECGDNQSKEDQGRGKIIKNVTIDNYEDDADNISEIFVGINITQGHNNSVLKSLCDETKEGRDKFEENDTIEYHDNDKNHNNTEEDKNNTNFARFSKGVSANCGVYQSKRNQGEERIVEKDSIVNDDDISETSYASSNIVQEDHNNLGLESLSNSGCDEYQTNEGEEKDMENDSIENRDNDKNNIMEVCSNIVQVDHNNTEKEHNNTDLERLSKSVSSECNSHQSKENQEGKRIVENDTLEHHMHNADEISKKCKTSNIVQEDHNNPSFEKVSIKISDGCAGHQTKENQGGEKHFDNDIIGNRDNDVDTTPETFCNSNIVQESDSIANLSKNMSDNNCAEYETKEVQDEEILIENRDTNAAKTLDSIKSSNIGYTFFKTHQETQNHALEHNRIENRVSDSCTYLKENNESEEILSENVVKCETSEELSSKTVCKANNLFEEVQNIVCSDSSSNSILCNNDNIEHHKEDIRSQESWFGDVTKERDYTGESSKPCDNSKIDQVDQNSLRPGNLSETVLEICTEHPYNDLVQNDQKKICPENLSYGILKASTKQQRKEKESSTEITTQSCDIIIGGRFDSRYVAREFGKEAIEDLANPNLKSMSSKSFENDANYKTENNHRDNYLESETVLNDTESNIAMSFQRYDSHKSNHVLDHVIQENNSNNNLGSLPNCIFDKCTKHQNKENTSLNETIIESDNIFGQCNSNTENIDYGNVENPQVHIENNILKADNQENSIHGSQVKRRPSLKRSLSESALYTYKNRDASDKQIMETTPLIWPPKRAKMYEFENSPQMNVIDENLCSFIHNNRRNSVSSFYNTENVSFCILIDNNCIITEENEEEKVCFAEISEECVNEINTVNEEEDNESEIICCSQGNELDFSDSVILDYENEKSIQEAWLDDVACVETVVSDDIEEDVVISASGSPRNIPISEYNESGIFGSNISDYNEINFINEETMPSNVYQIEETYRSPPHVDVIRTLYDREPQDAELCNVFYSSNCLEKILSESTSGKCLPSPTNITQTDFKETNFLPDDTMNSNISECNKNIFVKNITRQNYEKDLDRNYLNKGKNENHKCDDINQTGTAGNITLDAVQSSKSSMEGLFSYKKDEDSNYITSSSPEVSSTTFEEKNSSILLKITNYNGSRVSEVNEVNHNRQPRCKFTEEKEYSNPSGSFPKRPLITKAAQKYIPPLKESICDLKVKLALPQQRLLKLKQFKMSISEPKVMKQNNHILTIPKKPKPKPNFEDVLKNIDEVQIKMHREKSKKGKHIVPKVVIKKNLNGSHYTSSLNKDTFNPDLTGRKWQPWVFLEKNRFIDNMAIRNKTKAIFSHRRNTYVLAEKFKKYKSVTNCSAKFVISQPKTGDSSRGQLKYTIKLKHTY